MNLNNKIDEYKLSSGDDWQKESIHTDYFNNTLNINEVVFVGDYIVKKDDLREFNKSSVRLLTSKQKLEAILNLISITVDEDVALLDGINDYLSEVLENKIELVGIAEYYNMVEEELEE